MRIANVPPNIPPVGVKFTARKAQIPSVNEGHVAFEKGRNGDRTCKDAQVALFLISKTTNRKLCKTKIAAPSVLGDAYRCAQKISSLT